MKTADHRCSTKGAYIDESFANYKKQIGFDKRLAKLLNIKLNEDVLLSRGEFNKQMSWFFEDDGAPPCHSRVVLSGISERITAELIELLNKTL